MSLKYLMNEHEKDEVKRALQRSRFNESAAAKDLRISVRRLKALCAKHKIDVADMRLVRMARLIGELAS